MATPGLARALPKSAGLYMFVWRPRLRFSLASARDPGDSNDFRSQDESSVALAYVLYVGKAGDKSKGSIRERYKSYAGLMSSSPEKLWETQPPSVREQRLERLLCLRPLEFWFQECSSEDLGQLELRLIDALSPPGNRDGRRRGYGPARPAF